jgi:dihydroorotase
MNLILRNTTVIDPTSNFHQKKVDIQIQDGMITKIGVSIENNDNCKEINKDNLHVSRGWIDSSVCFGEPGFEDRETIKNGLEVASKSGFTSILLQPNTSPVIDNQSQIHFVLQKAKDTATTLFPIGAFTNHSDGKDLAEMFDMKNAGAIAFGDYGKSVSNANLLKIGLQYLQDFDGLLIAFAQDEMLKGNGVVNEGEIAMRLGLKGIPSLAEEITVARNLNILEYTGGRMHIPTISSAHSVNLIKTAKAKGIRVTCSVSVHHLLLTDETLQHFDTNYKVMPPLQNEFTRQALLEGIRDNTIDCITSDHNPIAIEDKKVEFDLAKNGTLGLETAFSSLMTVLPLEKVIEKLTSAATIFGIKSPNIEIGQQANLTLFSTEENWLFEKENILSKSKNSAFIGQKMKGKVIGVFNNNKLVI